MGSNHLLWLLKLRTKDGSLGLTQLESGAPKKELGFLGHFFTTPLISSNHRSSLVHKTVSSFHVPSGPCEGFPGANSEATLTFLSLGSGTTVTSIFQHRGACFTGILPKGKKRWCYYWPSSITLKTFGVLLISSDLKHRWWQRTRNKNR